MGEVMQALKDLGVDLLPLNLQQKAEFTCQCLEYDNRARYNGNANIDPCKHIVGLIFVLAARGL